MWGNVARAIPAGDRDAPDRASADPRRVSLACALRARENRGIPSHPALMRLRHLAPAAVLAAGALPLSAQERRSPIAPLEALPVAPPAATLRTGELPSLIGTLRLPTGRGPFPVVVLVHGGCWLTRFAADDAHLAPMAEALRDDGIATWSVRYRRVDEGGSWPVSFRDVAAGADSLRALARRFPLDTTRVAALGHSAGAVYAGFLAARPLMRGDATAAAVAGDRPLRVRGVVAVDGPLSLTPVRMLGPAVCGTDVVNQLVGVAPERDAARWRAASPGDWLANATDIRQAVVVGSLDAQVVTPNAAPAALRGHAQRVRGAVFVADTSDHFSMLDPGQSAWQATRDAVRHALGLAPGGRAGADRAAIRAAYRAFADGIRARRMEPAFAFLAPDFEHHTRRGDGGTRVASRANFVASLGAAMSAIDSVLEFTIDVRDVELRGDSSIARYRERVDLRFKPPQPGAAAPRDSSTSWWADRWVRTPAGWRAVRFVEVPAPERR